MFEIPEKGLGSRITEEISKLALQERRLGCGKSLGPMMSEPLTASLKAFLKFIDRNLNDPDEFPITSRLAKEALCMLNNLLGNRGGSGIITYGGSESNLTALFIVREAGFKTLVTSTSAHPSVFKAAKVLGIKLHLVGTDSCLRINAEEAASAVKEEDKAALLLTAGNTETGCVDDVQMVSDLVPESPIVIDGAFGGVILPFLREAGLTNKKADFTIPSVISVSVDGHKSLLTPIPSGALLLRNEEWLKHISFESRYLSSKKQVGLLWTRTGGSAASLWASLMYFGKEGLSRLFTSMLHRTLKLYESVLELGLNAIKPELPILCLWKEGTSPNKLLQFLEKRGWYLYRCPTLRGLRVTVLPHVTDDVINAFLTDLEDASRSI